MRTKVIILSLIASLFGGISANAQWRVGVTAGATYNIYSIDNHYVNDIHYMNAWGNIPGFNIPIGTFGIMAQYDIFDWFGIRADLNWTFKDHKTSIAQNETSYEVHNGYIQLPIMASCNFGNKDFRVFCNLGIYGAFWTYNDRFGKVKIGNWGTTKTIKYDFNNDRDQRFDYGLVGGTGIEWRFKLFKRNWSWQIIEARIYYSLQSTQKYYMKAKDPRYNTTLALQSGLCYFF